jgi:hypothetical protein
MLRAREKIASHFYVNTKPFNSLAESSFLNRVHPVGGGSHGTDSQGIMLNYESTGHSLLEVPTRLKQKIG